MLSTKPYLIPAFSQWIIDSGFKPILWANAKHAQCEIPLMLIDKKGEVRFNISPQAIRNLEINKKIISFRAAFSGVVHFILLPLTAVLAVYADEKQEEGIYFKPENEELIPLKPTLVETDWQSVEKNIIKSSSSQKMRSHLSVIE